LIVSDEGYFRNASCALNLISTFLSMESWVETATLVSCSGYNAPSLIRNLLKR